MTRALVRTSCVAALLAALLFLALDAGAVTFQRDELLVESGGQSHRFTVELALTPDQRARGLMFRTALPGDAGMLFLFPADRVVHMWMKNTLIPLDMIFIDSNRRIVGIVENAEPETETGRHVQGVSQYVLEIGGGLSQKWGVAAGSTVEFQGVPANAVPN
jgi:uncharacterized membrane protein (UPF0127 family)